MIAYLEGEIILKKEKHVVVKNGGVGYKVFLSKKALLMIPGIGQTLKLFCFTNVKEDAIDLYGFLNLEELEFFEILVDIRGIGPKAALEISSLGSLNSIKERILSKDEKVFEGISGIGKKKAMTIILELTGKIREMTPVFTRAMAGEDEAEDSLVALGFNRQKAKMALEDISKDLKSEERIRQALKILGQIS
jgi:holliday junction DNA helicase RuvA